MLTGLALRAGAHAELHPSRVAERPRVLYNNGTRAFVMWLHVDEADYELARVGIAVSHQPQVRSQGHEAGHLQLVRQSLLLLCSVAAGSTLLSAFV